MSELYELLNDYKNAYVYHKKFKQTKDTLDNIDVKERMAKMQGMYNTEKTEKENELLHKDNLLVHKANELQTAKLGRQNTIIFSGVIGLVVVCGFLFFMYRSNLEKKKANNIISQQKEEVEAQKKLVEHKNAEMLDSIRYAKHIQEAILPTGGATKILGDHFILYKPKDIVSGDFYWIHDGGEKIIVAAVDCTGHGVPGAFVSFVGHSNLIRCVNEFGLTEPGKILDKLNLLVNETLRQRMSDSKVRDGMDVSMLVIDKKENKLFFAGANNPLYKISEGVLTETKGNKQPVGTFLEEQSAAFTTHQFPLVKNEVAYIFTDGFADQFGGPRQKKFKYTQFKDVLIKNSNAPMLDQKNYLNLAFENWKGDLEQIDDVLVIGIKN